MMTFCEARSASCAAQPDADRGGGTPERRPRSLWLERGQPWQPVCADGPVWRVTQGLAAVLTSDIRGNPVLCLALPGDLLWFDASPHTPASYGLMALLEGTAVSAAGASGQALPHTQLLRQQQRQLHDMAVLRTGPVAQRVRHLLALVATALGLPLAALARAHLPSLKDMAQVVDSTHETVCRSLSACWPERGQTRAATPRRGHAPLRHRPGAVLPRAATLALVC